MIFSDRQRSVAQGALNKLNTALVTVRNDAMPKQPWLQEIELNALQSQITDIVVELQEYDLLKNGQVSFSERYSLSDLPRILIQARIAKGFSQSDLASALNMKPQQIQRYEATEYMGASLSRLIAISDQLEVRVTESFSANNNATGSFLSWSSFDDVAWDQFPGKEMIKREWLKPLLGESIHEAVKSYFTRTAGQQFVTALHRKKIRGTNKPNEFVLLAWQARILELAKITISSKKVPNFNHNDEWLPELVSLTRLDDGPSRAKKMLEENGIILVFEPHLTGSYLDGAAMLSPSDHPIIGMTLRFDRLDNFWFVLFHELGHVFRHLFNHLHMDFFDEEGSGIKDDLENEADEFALNSLILPNMWNLCLSRFALTEEAVKLDSERLNIHPSIIAGRIRKESGNYTILTSLVGQGKVRQQLEGVQ